MQRKRSFSSFSPKFEPVVPELQVYHVRVVVQTDIRYAYCRWSTRRLLRDPCGHGVGPASLLIPLNWKPIGHTDCNNYLALLCNQHYLEVVSNAYRAISFACTNLALITMQINRYIKLWVQLQVSNILWQGSLYPRTKWINSSVAMVRLDSDVIVANQFKRHFCWNKYNGTIIVNI